MPDNPVIAITQGEPSGIGPDISLRAAWELRHEIASVLIGDFSYLESLSNKINNGIRLFRLDSPDAKTIKNALTNSESVPVLHIPLRKQVRPGFPDPENALTVLSCLDKAIEGARQKIFGAIVTAPVQKSSINDAGIAFTGHTEYFAGKLHCEHVVMLLAGKISQPADMQTDLRVALATTHLALKDVPAAITGDSLFTTIRILHSELQKKFGIQNPRIYISGLNPHAGENGYLGTEETAVISPVIKQLQHEGMQISGPFPADTLFLPNNFGKTDCFLVMYHDQGLPVLKYAAFGRGVNITLGLPVIRTSVDHGTALDIAQKGIGLADTGSMTEAIRTAALMARFSS